MVKYKVISEGGVEKPHKDDVVVELKFELDSYGSPTISARNPGKDWKRVCWFVDNGQLALSVFARHVEGLDCYPDGEIKTR